MSKKYLAALITAILGVSCMYFFMTVVYEEDKFRIVSGLLVMMVEMVVLFTTCIILLAIKKTKQIGQGVLLGSFVTLIIGFGICTFV